MTSRSTNSRFIFRALLVLGAAAALALFPATSFAADEDGVALAIVYDTSGSMKEAVRTTDGQRAAKWIIGNRSLEQIVNRIEHFATNSIPPKSIHAGLYVFRGTGAAEAIKFGPFKPQEMRDWVKRYRGPNSGTPLGLTIDAASRALMSSKFTAKHILVVTDGINTSGPDPVTVVPKINKASEAKGSPIFIHFVAFDIDAKVFEPLKKLGVTVVGAADEKQLGQQLEFILEEKILLEKEPGK